MQRHNLTGADVGRIVGVESRAVRRWTGGFRNMPAAAWILLRVWGGEISVDELRAASQRREREVSG